MLFNFIQKEKSQVTQKKFKTIHVENWFGFFCLFSHENLEIRLLSSEVHKAISSLM